MRFRLIDQAKNELPIQRFCKSLGVSRSGYFAYRGRRAAKRQCAERVLLTHVRSGFSLSSGTYGSPRMARELHDDGIAIGRHRAARIMRENGMQARQKRRFKRTTDSHHAWPVAANIIDQGFAATSPDEKWDAASPASGHVKVGYASPCSLICSQGASLTGRRATGDRLHRDMALTALGNALSMRRPPEGLIYHWDRGRQYCSIDYQVELRRHCIGISMSGKGNCYDNAMVEAFFKTIKSELVCFTLGRPVETEAFV